MSHGSKQVEDRSADAGPAGTMFSLLNKILDFLFDKFKNLPPSLRTVAYFIFLAFFCATAWRLVGGQYVVHGVIWNGEKHASTCEIRLRSDFFSTNSKGMYYAVLSPLQYYRFVVAGEIDLPVSCGQPDGSFKRVKREPFKVKLNWWDDEFSDIDLSSVAAVPRTSKAPGAFSLSLIDSAYAQQPDPTPSIAVPTVQFPSSGDRLIIERITLGEAAKDMREVEFEIEFGEEERPLLLQGDEAGKLPIKPRVIFGERYYFDIPQSRGGRQVSIEMESPGFLFFDKEEEFAFRMPTQYSTSFSVKGSKGSILDLRLVPRTLLRAGSGSDPDIVRSFLVLREGDKVEFRCDSVVGPGQIRVTFDQTRLVGDEINGQLTFTLPHLAAGNHVLLWSFFKASQGLQLSCEILRNGEVKFRKTTNLGKSATKQYLVLLQVL